MVVAFVERSLRAKASRCRAGVRMACHDGSRRKRQAIMKATIDVLGRSTVLVIEFAIRASQAETSEEGSPSKRQAIHSLSYPLPPWPSICPDFFSPSLLLSFIWHFVPFYFFLPSIWGHVKWTGIIVNDIPDISLVPSVHISRSQFSFYSHGRKKDRPLGA